MHEDARGGDQVSTKRSPCRIPSRS